MRLLQLVGCLAASVATITLLLYVTLSGSHTSDSSDRGHDLRSQLYFHIPTSLFPPSALISLTDENSTFFLARPAAYGPLLPHKGMTGQLWIGSGFGDDYLGSGGLAATSEGELGCSDIPGWNDGGREALGKIKHKTPASSSMVDIGAPRGSGMGDAKGGPGIWGQRGKDPPKHGEDIDSVDAPLASEGGSDGQLHNKAASAQDVSYLSRHADIQSLQETAEIQGKIVLLSRGGCGFVEKTKWVQRRGGIALVVGDNVRGGPLVPMYARGDTSNITIPSIFTSHTTAHLLSSLMPSGNFIKGQNVGGVRRSSTNSDTRLGKGDAKRPWIKGSRPSLDRPKFAPSAESSKTTPFVRRSHRSSREQPVSRNSRLTAGSGGGWLTSFWARLRFDKQSDRVVSSRADSRRPPSSGHLDWSSIEGGEPGDASNTNSWFGRLLWFHNHGRSYESTQTPQPKGSPLKKLEETLPRQHDQKSDAVFPDFEDRDGLWITLSSTNMSSSPFFDSLLVLVISPLVTLCIVYALLLLRARIRRRRWRAPKSVVERLPVRTYHTMSNHTSSFSSPVNTATEASPTTPLLQHATRSPSAGPRPRSRTGSAGAEQDSSSLPEHEKGEAGMSEWRRRFGGKQVECVVCLEEYVDGVSRVMSLPCGHEFHADCITPWLTTRRRTCPICKLDVVRSMPRALSWNDRQATPSEGSYGVRQALVAENRNHALTAPILVQQGLDADADADLERGERLPQDPGSSSQSTPDAYLSRIFRLTGSSSPSGYCSESSRRLPSADRNR